MSKLEEINDRLEDEMRASSDPVLHVVADMNDLFSDVLQDLITRYKDRSDNGLSPIKPADLLLGYTLYTLGQFENMHKALKKPEVADEAGDEMLIMVITLGASRLIAHHMKLAGVGETLQNEIKEALSPCSPSGKD